MKAKRFVRFCTNCGKKFETAMFGRYHCPRCTRRRPTLRVDETITKTHRKRRR